MMESWMHPEYKILFKVKMFSSSFRSKLALLFGLIDEVFIFF